MAVETEEWNQERAAHRPLTTMRHIARDALAFGDDDEAFYTYAAKHQLTVNEVVYYLNAYEYGGEAGLEAIRNPDIIPHCPQHKHPQCQGLEAIRNPDIIPPEVARQAIKTVARLLDKHYQGQLPYRLTDEGTAVGLYEIQERRNGDNFLFPICQFRLTLASQQWHLYWMRKFEAWWPYSPPQRGSKYTLQARIRQVLEDEDGCFWG